MGEPFMFKFKANLLSLKLKAKSLKLSIDKYQELLNRRSEKKGRKSGLLPSS
jgi:hypothetical protein